MRYKNLVALLAATLYGVAAMAANITINSLPTIASVADATQFETDTGGVTSNKATALQIKNYTLTGNAASATKLATARAINGVNFDGTAPITISTITQSTPVTASGQTSLNLSTSIPSTAKRITVSLYGIRQSSTSVPLIQFGSGGSFQTTGYNASSYYVNPTIAFTTSTVGFPIHSVANSNDFYGSIVFTLVDPATNKWVGQGKLNDGLVTATFEQAGSVALSGTLDRVRLIMTNGTDTFTAGTASVLIE